MKSLLMTIDTEDLVALWQDANKLDRDGAVDCLIALIDYRKDSVLTEARQVTFVPTLLQNIDSLSAHLHSF
jgi:hypothetical protein